MEPNYITKEIGYELDSPWPVLFLMDKRFGGSNILVDGSPFEAHAWLQYVNNWEGHPEREVVHNWSPVNSGAVIPIENGDHLNFVNGHEYTISAWIQLISGSPTYSTILARRRDSLTQYMLRTFNEVLQYVTSTGATNGNQQLNIGQWYHVLSVMRTDNSGAMYIDGEKDVDLGLHSTIDRNQATSIGCYTTTSSDNVWGFSRFYGNMTDVVILGKALDDAEVKELYLSQLDGSLGLLVKPTYQVIPHMLESTGVVNLQGHSSLRFSSSGDLLTTGTADLAGSSSFVFSSFGDLEAEGIIALSGSSSFAFSSSGNLEAEGLIGLEGSSSFVFSSSGDLEAEGSVLLAGSSSLRFSSSGDLEAEGIIGLVGSSSFRFSSSADLSSIGIEYLEGTSRLTFLSRGDLKEFGNLFLEGSSHMQFTSKMFADKETFYDWCTFKPEEWEIFRAQDWDRFYACIGPIPGELVERLYCLQTVETIRSREGIK